ncbi:MAG: hypothetical protein ABI727_00820, partial [Nitrosospira sp.]
MIAALGARVAETNEEFVGRHGITTRDIRNAAVCHILSGVNRQPGVETLLARDFMRTKTFLSDEEYEPK